VAEVAAAVAPTRVGKKDTANDAKLSSIIKESIVAANHHCTSYRRLQTEHFHCTQPLFPSDSFTTLLGGGHCAIRKVKQW
jgi:hypothetical protein